MDYDSVMNNVGGGFLQGIIVAFVGLAAFLPASYVMNRYIYHKPAMRLFMGILTALAGLGALVILLLLRLYNGKSMTLHYFGMLPVLPEVEDVPLNSVFDLLDPVILFKKITLLFMEPLTFYYEGDKKDQDGYAATITNLLETFNTGVQKEINGVRINAVSEELFATGRALSEMTTTDERTLGEFIGGNYSPDGYTGITIPEASVLGTALFNSSST
jgi:hypothetical protein